MARSSADRARRFARAGLCLVALSVAGCAGAPEGGGEGPEADGGAAVTDQPESLADTAGGRLPVPGGDVWYEVSGDGHGAPLLLLHGGPGMGSRTMGVMTALGDDRPVVLYDQLGAGRSEKPTDTGLWTIERHIAELNAVRDALGLDEVHIMGHSWGSMLLIEYLLTRPPGVLSATFASPLFSTERWLADAKQRVTELPAELQTVIERHEAAGTTDSPEYQDAVTEFYRRFLVRTDPWPAEWVEAMGEFGLEVYGYMWGPSEFTATGTLRDWDRMDALADLDLPTLFTVGEYDETFPSTVEDYADRVEGSRFEVIAGAGHMTFVDAPDQNVAIVRRFLNEVDGR